MENLKKQGFTSVDKRAGVPLPCVKLALSSLAIYHAAASALLRKAGRGKKPEGLEWLFENLKVDGDAFIFQVFLFRHMIFVWNYKSFMLTKHKFRASTFIKDNQNSI